MEVDEKREANRKALEAMFAYSHKVGSKPDLTGQWIIKSPRPKGGTWYVAATCGYCTKVTPYFADASEGAVAIDPANGTFQTDCYFCGTQTRAHVLQLQSIRWE